MSLLLLPDQLVATVDADDDRHDSLSVVVVTAAVTLVLCPLSRMLACLLVCLIENVAAGELRGKAGHSETTSFWPIGGW